MRDIRIAFAAATMATVLSACGDGGAKCVELDEKFLDRITDKLEFTLTPRVTGTAAVKLPKSERFEGINYVAVIELSTLDDGEVQQATFGVGSPSEEPIVASGPIAEFFFPGWGKGINEDSPLDDYRDKLFVTNAASSAEGCLE